MFCLKLQGTHDSISNPHTVEFWYFSIPQDKVPVMPVSSTIKRGMCEQKHHQQRRNTKAEFYLVKHTRVSYLCFVKNTSASLNSLCLQSLCFTSPTNHKLFFVRSLSEHSTNKHYTQEYNVSLPTTVTAIIARLSTSCWDVLSWCDSRVIVSA